MTLTWALRCWMRSIRSVSVMTMPRFGDAAPPIRPVAVSGSLAGVVAPVVLREGAIAAAVEDDTRQLGWVHDVEHGFDEPARCLVGRHDQEKAIDPFRDDAAVRRRNKRRCVDDDVVVLLARL